LDTRLQALEGRVQGLTVTGGEPLQQLRPLTALLKRIRQRQRLSILLFSGYSWEEISNLRGAEQLLPLIDVLIAGRYRAEQRVATGLRGSVNKTLHF
jgi:anaerobic ribonucleoside-triphosphate reductase activating protein